MKRILPIIILSFLLTHIQQLHAQNTLLEVKELQSTPKLYTAKKISIPVNIDGQIDSIWNLANWSSDFLDIEGNKKAKPTLHTAVKMLWDDENLYLLAKLEEPHIWATLKNHDDIIYHDNDFEVFIKPDANSSSYYELEVNALNTVMDLLMVKPYRFDGKALMNWDFKGIKTAVHHQGSINNPNDVDEYWTVEIAIPFKSITAFGKNATPKPGAYWRINFSRVQWQHDIENGKYARKVEHNKLIPEHNWVWSPIGLINMHYPERWGFITFTDKNTSISLPEYYLLEKMAWNIHYLQRIHKIKHKKYASKLIDLEGYDSILKDCVENFKVNMTVNQNLDFYHVELKQNNTNNIFTIDNKGNYTTNYD